MTEAALDTKITGIAFIGPIASGKTTTSDLLNSTIKANTRAGSYYPVRLSFADALRREAAHMLVDSLNLTTQSDKVDMFAYLLTNMTTPSTKEMYRPLLRWWGTEWRRTQDPDYWVKEVKRRIDGLNDWTTKPKLDFESQNFFLIDDCRFPNEYEMLADSNFLFVYLDGNPGIEEVIGAHASEAHYNLFPYDIRLPWCPLDDRLQLVDSYLQAQGIECLT